MAGRSSSAAGDGLPRISGFTRLTEERGDAAAAGLAATVADIAQAISRQNGACYIWSSRI